MSFFANVVFVCLTQLTPPRTLVSEPDTQNIEKEGLVNGLGWKCTLCQVCQHTSNWMFVGILMCVYQKCFVHGSCLRILGSCEHQAEKIRTLLQVSGSAESSTGYRRFCSVHFHPGLFTRLWEIWKRNYEILYTKHREDISSLQAS